MIKKILLVIFVCFITIFFFLNFDFIIVSKRIHDSVLRNNTDNLEFSNYVQNVASQKVRGCTMGAKLTSLACYDFVFKWSLGEDNFNYLQTLILQKQELKPKARDLFEENNTLEYFKERSEQEKQEQAEIIKNSLL